MSRGPEQTFFSDPALDRAVGMIFSLSAELFVTRDRLRAMEVLLAEAGVLKPEALDRYVPDPAEAERLRIDRDGFVRALLESVKGEEASLSAPADLMDRVAG